ncbi:hypothetical protein [Microbacterium hominis]|uniref:hypothetical protein n=1 Tax=Microbacterium hominis TaxID=162426 RepID=UPI0020B770F8|nr:hypothetical protein [Microbacterium hominis]
MQHPDPVAVRELVGSAADVRRSASTGELGTTLPPFIDHHVHLALIDEGRLIEGGIAGVVDLGGDPFAFARRARSGMPHVEYAGAFLTAPGGYPSGRSWAPAEIVREVSSASTHPGVAGGAATAVDEQAACGASVIKVALHRAAGPVFDAATLAAIVELARERGLPVVAHVEGEGMPLLALDAGVDALAHTPFTETLDAALVRRAARAGQRWISTLDIHRDDPGARGHARANLAAYAAAGGRVLYGTDLGNGDLPIGVNAAEIAALEECGVRGAALVAALTDPWPAGADHGAAGVATFIPGPVPADLDAVPGWLAGARVVPTEELLHDDH